MKRLIIAFAGILIIAMGFGGGAGCTGSTTIGGPAAAVEESGSTSLADGWFLGSGEEGADDDTSTPPSLDDPAPTTDDPTPYSGITGDEECSYLNHGFDVVDKRYIRGDEADIVINAFGGSGRFSWRMGELPAGLRWEVTDDTRHVTISGTLERTETKTVLVKAKDLECPERGYVEKRFTIDVGINPDDLEAYIPDSPPVHKFNDCSREPAVVVTVGGNAVDVSHPIFPAVSTLDFDDIDEKKVVDVFKYNAFDLYLSSENDSTWVEFSPSVDGGGDRYTFDYGIEGENWRNGVENGGTFSVPPPERLGETTVVNIAVTDRECDVRYRFKVELNPVCRIARLDDVYIKMRAAYNKNKDNAFCDWTKAGFALVNTYYYTGGNIKRSAENGSRITQVMEAGTTVLDSDGGLAPYSSDPIVYDGWFRLSKAGDNNKIDDNPKIIEFDGDDIRVPNMCLEDINGVGFLLGDEGCAGKPSLKVRAVEVKACLKTHAGEERNKDYYNLNEADFSHEDGCYHATYQHNNRNRHSDEDELGLNSFGFRKLEQGRWGYQNRTFDLFKDDTFWYERRMLNNEREDYFE